MATDDPRSDERRAVNTNPDAVDINHFREKHNDVFEGETWKVMALFTDLYHDGIADMAVSVPPEA